MRPIRKLSELQIRFEKFISENGFRKTPERFKILKCVESAGAHFDAEDIRATLEGEGYHVSFGTVYNTLDLLCSAGILRRLVFDYNQTRYEIAGSSHAHLVCTECGRISEMRMPRNITDGFQDFHPDYISLNVYGKCKECQETNLNEENNKAIL